MDLITVLLLAVAPISPLAAEIRGPRLTALYTIRVIPRRDCNYLIKHLRVNYLGVIMPFTIKVF